MLLLGVVQGCCALGPLSRGLLWPYIVCSLTTLCADSPHRRRWNKPCPDECLSRPIRPCHPYPLPIDSLLRRGGSFVPGNTALTPTISLQMTWISHPRRSIPLHKHQRHVHRLILCCHTLQQNVIVQVQDLLMRFAVPPFGWALLR